MLAYIVLNSLKCHAHQGLIMWAQANDLSTSIQLSPRFFRRPFVHIQENCCDFSLRRYMTVCLYRKFRILHVFYGSGTGENCMPNITDIRCLFFLRDSLQGAFPPVNWSEVLRALLPEASVLIFQPHQLFVSVKWNPDAVAAQLVVALKRLLLPGPGLLAQEILKHPAKRLEATDDSKLEQVASNIPLHIYILYIYIYYVFYNAISHQLPPLGEYGT